MVWFFSAIVSVSWSFLLPFALWGSCRLCPVPMECRTGTNYNRWSFLRQDRLTGAKCCDRCRRTGRSVQAGGRFLFYSSLLESGCRSKVCIKSGRSQVPAFGSPRNVIVADSGGDCKTFVIRVWGICLHPHSGMNADEGVGSDQPEPSNSPLICLIEFREVSTFFNQRWLLTTKCRRYQNIY